MASRASGQHFVGIELGHYCIAEKIGTGGMGEVYRARDEHLARDVAIKVLPPGTLTDESARKHFHKEALILSQLNHPNIATVHDFDTQQGVDFLLMEYIPGIGRRRYDISYFQIARDRSTMHALDANAIARS
jgi:serine/threonine protein kinase